MLLQKIIITVISILIVLGIIVCILLLFLNYFNINTIQAWNTITSAQATLIAAILTAFVAAFTPLIKIIITFLWESLDDFLAEKTHKRPFKILLVGLGRVGKTTLIKNLGFQIIAEGEEETQFWRIHEHEQKIQPHNKSIKFLIGDYRGQSPGQIFENFDAFAGPLGKRTINCIIFVVDLYGDPPEINENVDDRIQQNITFLNRFALSAIFQLSYSKKRLKCVALFINKIDILQNFKSDAEKFALEKYKPFEDLIREFCNENAIPLIIKVGSATEGTKVNPLYAKIVNHYFNSKQEK